MIEVKGYKETRIAVRFKVYIKAIKRRHDLSKCKSDMENKLQKTCTKQRREIQRYTNMKSGCGRQITGLQPKKCSHAGNSSNLVWESLLTFLCQRRVRINSKRTPENQPELMKKGSYLDLA